MIKCKDCKYFHHRHYFENRPDIGHCFALDDAQLLETLSCAEATRRDGLTECCETCKHRNDELGADVSIQHCEKECWGNDSGINVNKMKCDEWEAE